MKLSELADPLADKKVTGRLDIEITSLVYDSRRVTPGALFVAVRGEHTDGHRHIASAQEQGAVAVVVDRESGHGGGTTIQVSNTRRSLALLAAQWYGHPADKLRMVGVTGTDGKTTTTFLLRALLQAAGYQAGLIGTVATYVGDKVVPSQCTTPEAPELQEILARMVDRGNQFAIMEVSSHALALDRVFGVPFEIAVFTNLTRDHLDFHGDFEHYRDAKALLFERMQKKNGHAIINLDDPSARFMIDRTEAPVTTFSAEETADISLLQVNLGTEVTEIKVSTPRGPLQIRLPLLGRYNVLNALAAIGAGVALNLPLDLIREGLEAVHGVDGRFEMVETGKGFSVIIDYAHTPEALKRLLSAVREMTSGRVLVIFGCGGDRDRGKRPQMAKVASEKADLTILTTDNPRSEDPWEILRDVERGIVPQASYELILDRREAIRCGLNSARSGDALVVAGRGHERFQIAGSQRIPFFDREVVMEELENLNG